MKVLIVEDEKITRITLANILKKEGYEVESVADGDKGLNMVSHNSYDVVVTDLRLPGKSGIDILKTAKEHNPGCEVIVITAYASVETAVSALKQGAYDYITKPLTPERFLSLMKNIHQYYEVRDENQQLKKRLERFENKTIIGNSSPMRQVVETAKNVAEHDYTVLIQGETGTGKEVIAKAIHQYSPRNKEPFIAINCAAIPESLIESELFGHEKGAFSGAVKQHKGYFERAHNGTIFIDDIDDFPLHLQVKLLRVLQERQFVRVGGTETITVDVRVICATKVDLRDRVRENEFREDLYYRLNIIPLHLPPLRERKEDIPALVNHFFEKHGAKQKKQELNNEFYDKLIAYEWPGNVRQLENLAERIIATGASQNPLTLLDDAGKTVENNSPPAQFESESYPPFEEYVQQKELEIISWALDKSNHNISKAAKLLDMPRGTLRSKLKKYELSEINNHAD